MIYHFQITPFEGVETLDLRNLITKSLEGLGYKWLESTGGQAAFQPVEEGYNGSFERFECIIDLARMGRNVTITTQECADPGLGLF